MTHQDLTRAADGRPEHFGSLLLLEALEKRCLFSAASGTGEVHEAEDEGAKSAVSDALHHELESQEPQTTGTSGDDADERTTRGNDTQSPTPAASSEGESSEDSAGQKPVESVGDESESEAEPEDVPSPTSNTAKSDEIPTQVEAPQDTETVSSQSDAPTTPSPEDSELMPISQSASQARPSANSFNTPSIENGDIESSSTDVTIDPTPNAGGNGFSNAPVTPANLIESTVYAGTLGAAFARQQLVDSADKLFADLQRIVSDPSSALQAVTSVVTPAVAPVLNLFTPAADNLVGPRFSAQRIFHFARIGDPTMMLSDAIAAFIDDSTSGTIRERKFGWREAAMITLVVALADVMLFRHLQNRRHSSPSRGKAATQAGCGT